MSAARWSALVVLVIVALMAFPSLAMAPGTAVASALPHPGPTGSTARAWPSSQPQATAYGADTWQEFQHDSSNTGLSGDTPVGSVLNWQANISTFNDGPNAPNVPSPVVGEGMVFMAHGDEVTAYNATSGGQVWNTTLQGAAPATTVIDSTPALWRGFLFITQDTGTFPPCGAPTGCSEIFVLNATSGAIATVVAPGQNPQWGGAKAPNSPVPISGPAFAGQSGVLFTDYYGYLYTYKWDGTTLTSVGSNGGHRVIQTGTDSTPAVTYLNEPGGGWSAFYIDCGDTIGAGGHSVIRAYEIDTPTPFTVAPGYPSPNGLPGGQALSWYNLQSGSIAVANMSAGGTSSWPYGFFGDDAGPGAVSHLVAMNLTAHTYPAVALLQATPTYLDSGVLSTPAIVSDSGTEVGLLLTDLNGTVSRWNFTTAAGPTGTLVQEWNRSLGSPIDGSPAIAGDVAYVVNSTGGLYALSVNTGNIEWQSTLSAATRSNLALGYSRLYVLSDPIGGGPTANLTAFGPAPGPVVNRLVASLTATPSQISPGTSSMLQARVTWRSPSGGRSGPAVGATVFFNVTGAIGGTTTGSPTTVQADGYAFANWTAATYSPAWYNVTVTVTATAPLNTTGGTTGQVTVMSGGTLNGGGGGGRAPLPLTVSVTPPSSTLLAGASETLTFSVVSNGNPVSGAPVQLSLDGPGSWQNAGPLTTGSTGTVTDLYTAPSSAQLPLALATLVNATSTLKGYANGSASAVILLQPTTAPPPAGLSALSVAVTPTATSVAVGSTVLVTLTVTNASDTVNHPPVAGATVTVVSTPAAPGSFKTPTSELTNKAGMAFFNFTGAAAGSVLATFAVNATKYVSTSTSVAISVVSTATPPPQQNTTSSSNNNGLRSLDWLLIALVVLLAVGLLAALLLGRKRRESPPPAGVMAYGAGAGAGAAAGGASAISTSDSSAEPAASEPPSTESPSTSEPAAEPAPEPSAGPSAEPSADAEESSPISVDEPTDASSATSPGFGPEPGEGSEPTSDAPPESGAAPPEESPVGPSDGTGSEPDA